MTLLLECRLLVVNILFQWIIVTHGQTSALTVCDDTQGWNNNNTWLCEDYQYSYAWCPNGTYTTDTFWTGGSYYSYPEFNCCGCGKGWPVWFVPYAGFTATQAVPEIADASVNNYSPSNLECIDTYGNSGGCNMKCKAWANPVTSLTTIVNADYNLFNCTLNLQTINGSMSFVLRIPQDNYLIYFTNWTTNDYNFSCSGNAPPPITPMLCRHDFVQCLSTTITDRYAPPNCADTHNWTNLVTITPTRKGWTCFEYEVVLRWCAGGTFTSGNQWTLGNEFNFPEYNCCACGKGSQPPYQLIQTYVANVSSSSPDFNIIELNNCSTSFWNLTFNFDFECLGSSNFITTNNTSSAILYNCPLDCFFDWTLSAIDMTRTISVSRHQVGTSISYYLTSELLPNFDVVCGQYIIHTRAISTKNTIPTTVQPRSTPPLTNSISILSSSTQRNTDEKNINTIPETTSEISSVTTATISQSAAWQPPTCHNGNIGLTCNVSVDPCQMANPCLNNGTCSNTNTSSYTCSCAQGFTGSHCEIDIRPCKPSTCLSHGQCNETSLTTFVCQCEPGYEGLHCESRINYCVDVKCQNNGQCRSILLNFTCECTTSDFTGRYCEIKSTSLSVKTAVKRSFAYIAILILIIVAVWVVVMDVLKYVFNIDPVEEDRKYLAKRRRQQQVSKRKLVQRFIYVNPPPPEPIGEESMV